MIGSWIGIQTSCGVTLNGTADDRELKYLGCAPQASCSALTPRSEAEIVNSWLAAPASGLIIACRLMPLSAQPRVFLSYARKDGAALAQRLYFPALAS